jgi:hypothetical protein
MLRSFDLFQIDDSDHTPMWVGSVNDMESVRQLIRRHAGKERKRFLVWAQETQCKSFYDATQDELVPVDENLEA